MERFKHCVGECLNQNPNRNAPNEKKKCSSKICTNKMIIIIMYIQDSRVCLWHIHEQQPMGWALSRRVKQRSSIKMKIKIKEKQLILDFTLLATKITKPYIWNATKLFYLHFFFSFFFFMFTSSFSRVCLFFFSNLDIVGDVVCECRAVFYFLFWYAIKGWQWKWTINKRITCSIFRYTYAVRSAPHAACTE